MTDRSFSARFAVYALVALLLSAAAALPLARASAQRDAIASLDQQARLVASVIGPNLRPGDLARALPAALERQIARSLGSGPEVLLMRIRARDGSVRWASATGYRHAESGDDPHLRRVLAGKTTHERLRIDAPDGSSVETIEAVAPILVDGRPEGVLEVYRSWQPTAAQIRRDVLLYLAMIGLALLLVYAALFPILRRLLRERSAAEERLRSREQLSQAIVEHAAEGIWVLGPAGLIEFVNPKLQSLLGYRAEQMIGKRISQFALIEPAQSGRQELLLRRADASFVWTLVSTHALGEGGGTVSTIVDIHDLKGTEESLHGATRRLGAIVHAQREIVERETDLEAALQTVIDRTQELTGASAAFVYFQEGDELVLRAANHAAAAHIGKRVPIDASIAGLAFRTGAVQTSSDVRRDERAAGVWREEEVRSVVLVPLSPNGGDGVPAVLGISGAKPDAFDAEAIETARLMAEFASAAIRNAEDVREREQLLAAVAAGEERFRAAIESSPIGFALCSPDDRFIVVNEAYCRIVGRTRGELTELTWRDLTHPDDLVTEETPAERLLEGALPHLELEKRMVRADGTTVWVHMHVSMVRDPEGRPLYGLAQVQDVTEQRQLEQSVRVRERLFRAVFDQALVATLLFDDEGRIVDANARTAELVGIDRARLIGRNFADFELEPGSLTDPWQQLLRDGTCEGEAEITIAGGARRTIIYSSVANVQPGLHLTAVQDVTEQRRLEERVRQGQKLEAVGRLAGGVAHDFNNMLTAISGYTDLLLARTEGDETLRGYARQIEQASQRAAGLTRQLLAFSRRQVLQPRVIDLNEVIDGTRDMITRLIGEHVRLETALDRTAAPVLADEGQLEQVVVNLAVNARDAMPGGGSLLVETATVELTEPEDGIPAGRYTTLTMTDTGVGMDGEQLERLFEPFYSTKGEAGVGLGLATVYGIVNQSGGHISVTSEPGHGACFRILLPATQADAPASAAPPEEAPAAGADATVLLVEDEPAVRAVVAEMLEGGGYRVLAATDGAEALRLAATYGGPIDLLVTDVVMPGMSGQEVARRIAEERPTTRTLFVSGYNESAIAQHGVLAPGTAFLEKPFSAAELVRKARDVLDGVAVG